MGFDWKLQLQRYVIEDGNPEHYVGEVFTWVAEFHFVAVLELSTVRERSAVPVERDRYRVNAEVIYISQDPRHDCCVLDFGITAISESGSLLGVPLPPGCREGDYVAGDVWLEYPLCTCIQPYDIRHTWRVNRITVDPLSGDPSRADIREIPDTGSLKAESYTLHCSHVSGPAAVSGKPPIDEKALPYLKPFRT